MGHRVSSVYLQCLRLLLKRSDSGNTNNRMEGTEMGEKLPKPDGCAVGASLLETTLTIPASSLPLPVSVTCTVTVSQDLAPWLLVPLQSHPAVHPELLSFAGPRPVPALGHIASLGLAQEPSSARSLIAGGDSLGQAPPPSAGVGRGRRGRTAASCSASWVP